MEISFLKEKKKALVAFSVLALTFSLAEFFIVYPIINIIKSFSRYSNIFEGTLTSIKLFFNLVYHYFEKIRFIHVSLSIILLLVATFFIGILLTIVISEINNFIKKENKKIDKNNLVKILSKVLVINLASIVLLGLSFVASLPAFLITAMYYNGSVDLVCCIFLDIMTILTIVSFFIYVRMSIWGSLENVVSNERKKISDNKFKKLVINFIVFDILYILTRIITITFFSNFDGVIIRTSLFCCLVFFNFVYEALRTYNILDILKN